MVLPHLVDHLLKTGCPLFKVNRADVTDISMSTFSVVITFNGVKDIRNASRKLWVEFCRHDSEMTGSDRPGADVAAAFFTLLSRNDVYNIIPRTI